MPDFEILILDDEEQERELMQRMLEEEGLEILTAGDSKTAYQILEEETIKLVLLDIDLGPDSEDGFAVCKNIRAKYYNLPLQIVLISGYTDESSLHRGLSAGADDFIKKPFSSMELVARVRAARIRYMRRQSLFEEREYFKHAVRKEKDLSARVLDENLQLKKAYQQIYQNNEELEASYRDLERIAKYDMLSGLYNRMNLINAMDMEIERAIRNEQPLSCIMLDIDNFKRINDEYGHQCGDQAIRSIGRTLNSGLRKYDHAGRYGGEEFIILLPTTDHDQALTIAERFRESIEKTSLSDCIEGLNVTASLGVAQFRPGENREHWIERADRAMYTSKQRGKNNVCGES